VVPQRLGVTAGVEANFNQTESHSFEEDMPPGVTVPKDFDIEGVYAELDGQPTEWLGFTGGVRYDRNSVVETRLSPRAALFVAKPERYGLKLLYAEGFRNPSAFEAFFHDDTSFIAPDHLGAETIRSYEAVVWAKPIPGLSTRISGYRWDAHGIVTSETVDNPFAPGTPIQQFQNAGRLVSNGIEVEASYRDSRGWYGFGGFNFAEVGADDDSGNLGYGSVINAPQWTGGAGVSSPKLWERVHVSTELVYIGERTARAHEDGTPESSPGWLGWSWAVYAPSVHGFDVTAGVRNLIGHRDFVVTPGDYDRGNVVLPRVPGEGREVYVKVGYSY
jgi:iron complex outermembrane receptor protein